MISITADRENIMAVITASSRQELDDQVREVQDRYYDHVMDARGEPQVVAGRWFVILASTVDLF